MTILQSPIDSAPAILQEASRCISDRASERDQESERSMARTVASFNAMYNLNLTEEQGWMFMVFLKAARASGGSFKLDDYVDGAAYFALAGEAAMPVPEQLSLELDEEQMTQKFKEHFRGR
nr:MAG: Nucleotide modification associated domain 1 [Bacteriophage sp.]